MKLFCANTRIGLIPLYPDDLEEKRKLKFGEIYSCEIKTARNYLFLKKFWALCKMGFENSKEKHIKAPTLDLYRKFAIMKAGFVDITPTAKGNMITPQSISFDNMDEAKFQEVYGGVLNFIMDDIEASKEDIEKELGDFF